MNNLQIATGLFTAPAKTFEAIAEKPRWLFPFLLVLLCSLGLALWYYGTVDVSWLIDKQISSSPQAANLTEEQRARIAQFSNRGTIMLSSTLVALILMALIRVLEAVWYTLAGKVTNVDQGFRKWFSLACWTSIPGVLAVIPAALGLLTANTTQLDPSVLTPLSLNELFFHREIGERGYSLLSGIGVLQIVGAVLAIIGVHTWSKRSWLFSSVFVLLPVVLILAVFVLLATRAS